MSTEESDPLEDLVVDRQTVNKERVVDVLNGVLKVDTEGEFIKYDDFYSMNTKEKMVATLLGQWVANQMDLSGTTVVDVGELSNFVGISNSGVRRYATELGFIETDPEGIRVPGGKIIDAVDFLEDNTVDL